MDLIRKVQAEYRLPEKARTIGEMLAEARQQSGAQKLSGHDIMALERFDPATRHMIVFDVLTHDSPVGWKGEKMRLFLTDAGYSKALENQEKGHIKIRNHAKVLSGDLHYDHIPFGKVTIVQGNPGEGKTTFALRLAAACTTGGTLPGMKPLPPFQVIYQTAEDGLGDTVKPRLMEAEADLDRVLVIDEAKRELTLSDERIEKAIVQNGARLIILDPIQAYMGEKTDMNRANEVRPMFRRLADVAERTGCAVILIGHLNKAAGGQSAYRGLGSIDFRAAARSVLLIGRVKREPNVRVIIHDKSSLAPEGKPIAFCLDPDTGFEWIGEYDITADELLSGAGGNTATKTEQAEKLILDLLADGKELASEDIEKAAAEAGISARTVRAAKKNLDGRIISKRIGAAWYHALKK
ncbi:MAG: DUF5720 family protein [Flavonifractor plautii]